MGLLAFDIGAANRNIIVDSTLQLKYHLAALVSVRKELAASLIQLGRSKETHPWFQSNLMLLMEGFRRAVNLAVKPYSNIIDVLEREENFTSNINNEIIR